MESPHPGDPFNTARRDGTFSATALKDFIRD